MAEELRAKSKRFAPGEELYDEMVTGNADLGFSPVGEILARSDRLDYAGTIPAEIQNYNQFSASVMASSKRQEEGGRFIAFLRSKAFSPLLQKNGLEAN